MMMMMMMIIKEMAACCTDNANQSPLPGLGQGYMWRVGHVTQVV